MLEDYDIVCISTLDWESVWGSRQAYMNVLKQKNRIYFVQEQIGFEHLIKHPQYLKKFFKSFFSPIKFKDKNLSLIELPILLPGKLYFKSINWLNQKISKIFLKLILKKLI